VNLSCSAYGAEQGCEIEKKMYDELNLQAKSFGIEIEVVGIRRLGISESVTPMVFERMGAERSRKKVSIITEGKSEPENIKS
jgi:regulator of protease activity HflC (stomatin/prohibitin superfamily)